MEDSIRSRLLESPLLRNIHGSLNSAFCGIITHIVTTSW